MAREQWGICTEANLHGLHLFFNAHEGYEPVIREALSQLPKIFDEISEQFSEGMFSGVIAIGASFWQELYPDDIPPGLKPFPAMGQDDRQMPASPMDLFIQLRSDRQDVNYIASRRILTLFGETIELIEQVPCFRYLDGRDLTGFVDGTENPKGRKRREIALLADAGKFTAGSFVHVQRYRHHLNRWDKLPTQEQELIIGRTKMDDKEFSAEDMPLTAHVKRSNVKNAEGKTRELMRQSMPYGDLSHQGLLFISYCADPDAFSAILSNMVVGNDDGDYDHLLNYTTAETGAAFFAPSVDFLVNQGSL
ncbi:Dyp-type peroxidase [Psychrosphaera sp. B3R10]|uniref:Dyp-type peroxidase n=1 Tax=unclassified Psychrosphaera TaxID=2641570 RepID=UPI001C08AA2D|nr:MULTISPECIES: Dyp-type peroxidase [unclassified Psychrosphaera]MBU2882927.1 Dyp-type peroxidase [Psychrosphaera sp. I2R16]MBU2991324.1 Dyp-type peroxidase [Psychrosphaera sp. B3R10]MDO6720213.1 Dyp-type peroxidase [Psychrosphaera sp. 1_MG-2023]